MNVKFFLVRMVKFLLLGVAVFFVVIVVTPWLSASTISKAKYAKGASLVSVMRTKINVYQRDTGSLPGLQAAGETQKLNGTSYWQKDLVIPDTYFSGQYFGNDDFQYYVEQPLSNAWVYCVAASGAGSGKSPQKGTAYAVLEIRNLAGGADRSQVLTYERYVPDSDFMSDEALIIQAFNTVDPGDDARANCIPIPTWSVITGALMTVGGELDLQLLKDNFGFHVQ